MRSLSIRLLATLALALFASSGHAQQLVNCATSTPCVNNGPESTGTGDQLPTAGTKINANFQALPAEFFNGVPLSEAHGGTNHATFAAAFLAAFPTLVNGDCLTNNGTALSWSSCGGGGGTPGGSAFSIQYNNSGAFGGLLPGSPGTYCLVWSSISAAPTIGSCPGAGGGAAFGALTSGTNTAMAGICGTGCSIAVSGSGTIGATSAPLAGISGAGTGVITFLTTPSSANLLAALTDETGTGSAVFATSPLLVTPTIKGSSTGFTTVGSANASTSNFTATLPASTGTLAELNLAQSWSALQTFPASDISIAGTTITGVAGANVAATSGSLVSGHCPQFSGTAGLMVDSGAACGGGGGAVSSVSAGTSGLISVTPTTGAVVVDAASIATGNVYGNVSGSTGTAGLVTMTALQAALVAANQALVTATAPTGPTNDYAPSGFGTTTAVLYLTPTSGGSTIDGLVAGSAMQQVLLINAEAAGGADSILLINQSSSDSTAVNRFQASGNLVIPPGGRVDCVYLASTITRWNCH